MEATIIFAVLFILLGGCGIVLSLLVLIQQIRKRPRNIVLRLIVVFCIGLVTVGFIFPSISIVLAILFVLLSGCGIALLVLIPPIRERTRSDPRVRMIVVFCIGLLAFGVVFPVWTWLLVEIPYIFLTIPSCCERGENSLSIEKAEVYEQNQSLIVNELWIRLMIPPSFRDSCYTLDTEICDLADSVLTRFSLTYLVTWKDFMMRVGFSCISLLLGSGLAWYYTTGKT